MNLHIHIHHYDGDKELNSQLNSINQKLNLIMTKQERFDQILSRLDTVTTDIAGDFRTFVKEVQDGTVSDESLAKAEANITKLEEIAASKENPVPGDELPNPEQPEGQE